MKQPHTPPPTGLPWLDAIETKRGLLTGAVVIVCVAMLLVTAMRNPVDYDGYWHLRMGLDWIENGLSPFVDHYSFTFPGESIGGVPYMFQVGLYGMVKLFGEQGGMIAMKLALFIFILACMIAWLEQIKPPALGYMAGLAILVLALQLRAQVRPELLTYGFIVVALMLYFRSNAKASAKSILPIFLFLVLWGNYHSPILGFIIFFGLFVDIAIKLIRDRAAIRKWLGWAFWGAITLGAGFLRPGLHHPLIGVGQFMENWNHLIQEYLPPLFLLQSPFGYFVILIIAITVLGLVAQRKIGLALVAMILAYYTSNMARLVAPTLILCATLLPLIIRDWQYSSLGRPSSNASKTWCATISIALLVCSLCFGVLNTRAFMRENLISWTMFPVQLVSYFEESGRNGNIFNDYETGGFLIYKLSPESKVYIDGRSNILYPLEHYKRYLRARSDPNFFQEESLRMGIDHAILRADDDTAAMMNAAGWSLEFMDINFALYQPSYGHLDHFGKLWGDPYCWNEEIENSLPKELAHIRLGTGTVWPSTALMHYSLAYTSTNDRVDFLEKSAINYDDDDAGKRFLAGRAVNDRVYETALSLASEIETRTPLDDLIAPIVFANQGEWQQAQSSLETALGKPWRVVLDFEKELQFKTLIWIKANSELSATLSRSHAQLANEVDASFQVRPVSIADFCIQ